MSALVYKHFWGFVLESNSFLSNLGIILSLANSLIPKIYYLTLKAQAIISIVALLFKGYQHLWKHHDALFC